MTEPVTSPEQFALWAGHPTATLTEACELTDDVQRMLHTIGQMARERRHRWLAASRGGITYTRIAQACGVHLSLVSGEIQKARQELAELPAAARLPRTRPRQTTP